MTQDQSASRNGESLIERLIALGCGGCTCDTKTPELKHHAPTCRYRTVEEAAQFIAATTKRSTDSPRFFIDHGMIHDRLTGRHIHGDRDMETGIADEAVAMLNALAAPVSETGQSKPYWLLERNCKHKHMSPKEPVLWFRERQRFAQGDIDQWTPHADKAKHFDTKEDAEEYLKNFEGDDDLYDPLPEVTQHLDCIGPAPHTAKGA